MDMQNPDYDPNAFIDWLIKDVYKVKNDAALAHRLEMSPVQISKIRHRRYGIGALMLVCVHEDTGMHVRDIKARMYRKPVAMAA